MIDGLRVVVAICPECGNHVEWQGNDYGYLCQGPVDARHLEANAVETTGTFYADATETPANVDPSATMP